MKPLVFRLTLHQALVYALLDQLFTSIFAIIYIHNIFHKKMTLIIVIRNDKNDNDGDDFTAWKASKYGVFSGPYFPVCGLNTEIYGVYLRVQSEYRKIRTRKNQFLDTFRAVFVFLFCFCGMFNPRKVFNLVLSWNHNHRISPICRDQHLTLTVLEFRFCLMKFYGGNNSTTVIL